jgi:hypothetical protein
LDRKLIARLPFNQLSREHRKRRLGSIPRRPRAFRVAPGDRHLAPQRASLTAIRPPFERANTQSHHQQRMALVFPVGRADGWQVWPRPACLRSRVTARSTSFDSCFPIFGEALSRAVVGQSNPEMECGCPACGDGITITPKTPHSGPLFVLSCPPPVRTHLPVFSTRTFLSFFPPPFLQHTFNMGNEWDWPVVDGSVLAPLGNSISLQASPPLFFSPQLLASGASGFSGVSFGNFRNLPF